MKFIIIAAIALLAVAAACTTEKIVYVMPDGTEVTPTAAQATQAAGGGSQAAAPQSEQPKSASESASPAPSQAAPASTSPSAPAPAVNQRWNDKRNTLCSSLGLNADLCEKISLNQTGPDGETQDIDLPDEPETTPVPVDDVGDAVEELQEIVQAEGEVSIQVLTYTENLIQQAADAVVQAEQELANQEATAAYLDAKKQELQELRQTYARLLERIGVAQDRSLALAEQVEQEHLAFSIERANGEALIRYKDARLAHTNALAEAEKAAIAQIEGIAAANELASTHEAETTDLAPLYTARDKAQSRYEEAVKEFEKQVQEYERKWLEVYEYYIADLDSKPPPFTSRRTECSSVYIVDCYIRPSQVRRQKGRQDLISGNASVREQGKTREYVNLTLLWKDLSDVEREIVRAIARNEKAQDEVTAKNEEASTIGIAVTNARLAVVEAYTEHGISEGRAGGIFRFTDNGEDAVTYNLSLVALNQQADLNLSDFESELRDIVDTLNKDIQTANATRTGALEEAEDVRYTSADTDAQERQAKDEWDKMENLRGRIIMLDSLIMLVGWGRVAKSGGGTFHLIGFNCAFSEGGSIATGTGRDAYIRKYWHKEQPLNRTYTKERLDAVTAVLDNLEGWLQERIDYWETQERSQFSQFRLVECEIALHGNPKQEGWQGVREWRQSIVASTTPLPD